MAPPLVERNTGDIIPAADHNDVKDYIEDAQYRVNTNALYILGSEVITGSYEIKNIGSTINEFSTDVTLGDDSDSAVPTEHAVKTYVDTSTELVVGTVSTTYTIGSEDVLLADPTGGNFDVTLPTATPEKKIDIKNLVLSGANKTVTVVTPGAETIDNSASFTINKGESITVTSDDTNWWII